ILFYPPTRMNGEFQSQREFEKGYYLEMDTIRWLSNYFYNSTDEWDDSFGHPLLRDKSALSASPNALFIIAECDPLRDEGLAYADKLKDAGGHVEIYVMEGVIHSFFTLPQSVCIIVRVYKPTICQDNPPILIYFHGGGFVTGQLHSVETTCKKIACLSKCIVVSVDYRLAPEYKYPTCFYDGICTTKWVIGNKPTIGGNEQSIVGVCGSSAGGTIAAVVALEVPSIRFQILFYPSTHMNGEFQSQREFEKGYFLEMDTMRWLSNYFYSSTDEWDDSFGHPLLRDKSALSASPNALFIIAECDPLRDEGLAYADKLKDAGGHVEICVMEGVIHSFFTLPRHFRSNWSKAYSKVDAFIAKCKLEQ
ncbi:ethyl acetate hydrolase-like, partial [Saccoglossus kowalevskii]|uniref:Gibberellin receptor GID1A-like n=1 Tax=Saccoglossus kowalevskii TaxID=10224 RepID=A0ABM0MV00_SACKO